MIIGIDGNEANVKDKVGVSVYTLKLLEYFRKVASDQLGFKVFLKNNPLIELPEENQFYKYEVVRGNFFWSHFFLPLRLFRKRDIDVFFSPAHYSPRFCPVPSVVTVHDLSYFYYPDEFLKKDLYKLKNWTAYSVNQAKKIIAVSKTTKKDLEKFYGVPDSKVEVVYNGYEKRFNINNSRSKTFKDRFNLEKNKYILFVGTIQPRKNIITLIKAFSDFAKTAPDFKLVLAGKKGWLFEETFKTIEDLGLKDQIIFTDYVSDEALAGLYKNGFCFVLPSFYEGFGIPILEAMSFDCPVISSFSSSLPEVGGEACLYFDPDNQTNLQERINELKNNNKLRKDLVKKGRERLKQFSWEKCGEETLMIIKANGN